MENGSKPIHPLRGANGAPYTDFDIDCIEQAKPLIGLTKREHLAAMALVGLLSSPLQAKYFVNDGHLHHDSIALEAVQCADALLNILAPTAPVVTQGPEPDFPF